MEDIATTIAGLDNPAFLILSPFSQYFYFVSDV